MVFRGEMIHFILHLNPSLKVGFVSCLRSSYVSTFIVLSFPVTSYSKAICGQVERTALVSWFWDEAMLSFFSPERNIEILDLFTLLTLPLSWSKSCKTLSYTITMETWWGLCCQTHESLEPMRTSQPSVSRCCRKLLFSCFSSLCYWIVCLILILWICLKFAQSPEWWLAL